MGLGQVYDRLMLYIIIDPYFLRINNRAQIHPSPEFRGGLSVLILRDYIMLWHALADVALSDDQDRFTWRWTSHGDYTASSAYRAMHIGTIRLPGARWIWKSVGHLNG